MNITAFRAALNRDPNSPIHLMLPDGDFVPAHFHVTEIGRVQKDFIDCGGTARSSTSCVLQTWVANDTAHRLTAGKLARVFELAESVLRSDELPMEIEYENGTVSVYPVAGAEFTPAGVLFHLGRKHTDCLAPDRCKVTPAAAGCAPGAGCC